MWSAIQSAPAPPKAGVAQGQREAHGPPPFPDTGATEGGYQTARAGRDVAGISRQLRPQHIHHAPRDAGRWGVLDFSPRAAARTRIRS